MRKWSNLANKYSKLGFVLYGVQLMLLAMLVYGSVLNQFADFPAYSNVFILVLGLIILVVCISSVFFIRRTYRTDLLAQRRETELLRLRHVDAQNRLHRHYRHDLYNHLTVISGMAQLGKLDKLMEYLDAYLGEINQGIFSASSGLKEVDVLLYTKFAQAEANAVPISFQFLEPLECRYNQVVGIVTIFANALDNAIRAAATADGEPRVSLEVVGDKENYIITVTNTYDAAINLSEGLKTEGFTTKRGGEGGQGVAIIRKAVRSLRGVMAYDVAAGLCSLRVELPRAALMDK